MRDSEVLSLICDVVNGLFRLRTRCFVHPQAVHDVAAEWKAALVDLNVGLGYDPRKREFHV